MKNDNKGSVLVWAIAVILIFAVFAAAALSVSYAMVQRSANENMKRQLELTAKSSTITVSAAVVDSANKNLLDMIVNNAPNAVSQNNIFPSDKEMGDCVVTAKCNSSKDMIIVSSTSAKGDLSFTFSAVIKKQSETTWAVTSYDTYDIDYVRNG